MAVCGVEFNFEEKGGNTFVGCRKYGEKTLPRIFMQAKIGEGRR